MLDLHTVLGLPPKLGVDNIPQDELKAAYRRSLLQSHPDKATARANADQDGRAFTVDEVTLAYKTLANPTTRLQYLKERRQQQLPSTDRKNAEASVVESADLDDFTYDSELAHWTRPCRCGARSAYVIADDDLAHEAQNGVIIVGCEGCSIWLQVFFQEAEDPGLEDELEEEYTTIANVSEATNMAAP